jgi:hypothetical protein
MGSDTVDMRDAVSCQPSIRYPTWHALRIGLLPSESTWSAELESRLRRSLDELDRANLRHTVRARSRLRKQVDFLKLDFANQQQQRSASGARSAGTGGDICAISNPHTGVTASLSKQQAEGGLYLPVQPQATNYDLVSDVADPVVPATAAESAVPKCDLVSDLDVCPYCKIDMRMAPAKGTIICEECGLSQTFMDVTVNALPYRNNVELPSFSYKRINHFNDWLMQVQGKESMSVPDSVCTRVRELIVKRNIPMEDVNNKVTRDILKALKMNKMYDHITQITHKVTGRKPPHLSIEIEEKCRLMFIAIQRPFEVHCPPERKNFLSYPYCLFKFLELLGCTEILDSFILLKGKDKLRKQDLIFKKICETLDWEFIRSV